MNKLIFSFLVALATDVAFAQGALPSNIKPLDGEVIIRLIPGFESRCTKNSYEKNPGDFFGKRKSETSSVKIYEETPGVAKLAFTTYTGLNYLRITLPLNSEGTGFASAEADIDSDLNMPSELVIKLKSVVPQLMNKASGYSILGNTLQQGTSIKDDFCDLFPGGQTLSKSGQFVVTGTSQIKGRESIIISGNKSLDCGIGAKTISYLLNGWYAFDLQSGLQSINSISSIAKSIDGVTESTEDNECVITGSPTKAPQPMPTNTIQIDNSNEKRLIELRALFEKGLITPEQYEKKRSDIINKL